MSAVAGLPRRRLALLPTPLHRLPALERHLGAGPVRVKRDDLTGLATAGNKARPLEFLVADALAARADVLVTGGGPGSNFVAAAALAARTAGLDSEILVPGPRPARLPVNLGMARACGAVLTFCDAGREDLDRLVDEHAAALGRRGRRPYAIPRGGATPVGALGFACAATELDTQLRAAGCPGATVVLPTGSGASLAGLIAGRATLERPWPVIAVSVSRPVAALMPQVLAVAAACAALTGGPAPSTDGVEVVDAVGAGFGQVTAADISVARLALRADGLLLDGTYGAKALAALVAAAGAGGAGGPDERGWVLWHTGGLPGALAMLAEPGPEAAG